jgi:hypothetical protein
VNKTDLPKLERSFESKKLPKVSDIIFSLAVLWVVLVTAILYVGVAFKVGLNLLSRIL